MIDADIDVFPNAWLLNGVDNSIGAKWKLNYRSMTNTSTHCTSPAMTTWGQTTNFGDVTLGTPGVFTPKEAAVPIPTVPVSFTSMSRSTVHRHSVIRTTLRVVLPLPT